MVCFAYYLSQNCILKDSFNSLKCFLSYRLGLKLLSENICMLKIYFSNGSIYVYCISLVLSLIQSSILKKDIDLSPNKLIKFQSFWFFMLRKYSNFQKADHIGKLKEESSKSTVYSVVKRLKKKICSNKLRINSSLCELSRFVLFSLYWLLI